MERIKPRSTAAYHGDLTYNLFRPGEIFYSAFLQVTNQTWGGRADTVIQKIARTVIQSKRDYEEIREKYVKSLGRPVAGGYTLEGISGEDSREFDAAMEELHGAEIEMPVGIELPVQLIKHKKNDISPVQAAAVQDIFTIKWNESDDGNDLDK